MHIQCKHTNKTLSSWRWFQWSLDVCGYRYQAVLIHELLGLVDLLRWFPWRMLITSQPREIEKPSETMHLFRFCWIPVALCTTRGPLFPLAVNSPELAMPWRNTTVVAKDTLGRWTPSISVRKGTSTEQGRFERWAGLQLDLGRVDGK